MPWCPSVPGEAPTLGGYVVGWIKDNLIVPDGPLAGQPFTCTPEQTHFILKLYELDPHAEGRAVVNGLLRNARIVRRAIYSRSKGTGKSPFLAALCWAEALAEVVFDGWDADGRPVGAPWSWLGFKPKVQIVAVSEDQTANTWDPLLEMGREGHVLTNYRGVEILETFVNVPRGRIEFTTSAARSREGFRPVFSVLDQTESWTPSVGGPRLAATIRRNLVKTGGCSVESPNAYIPGEQSVAERSFEAWDLQQAGKLKEGGIYLDHREAPPECDPSDRDSLLAGLKFAYGDSTWVDLDRVIADYYDPNTDPQDARRFFLNQVTHASDSYISAPEWAACKTDKKLADGDMIALGFDGSRARAVGKPDASALIACRLSDGHLAELGVWETDDGPRMNEWEAPTVEIDAAVEDAFARYVVAAFYADPAKDWRSKVDEWENKYPTTIQVKVSQNHPFEWWFNRQTIVQRAVEAFEAGVRNKELTHDGSYALTKHVLATRRRIRAQKLTVGKVNDYSPHKIDACVAAILAWQARLDCMSAGLGGGSNAFVMSW